MRSVGAIVLGLGLIALAGCATVSFKRGASPGDSAADESACHQASKDAASYAECMRARGWLTSAPETAPAPVVAPTAATLPKTSGAPAAAVGAQAAPAAASPAADTSMVPVPAVTPKATTTAAPPPSDPLAQVAVDSWWKIGGSPADLDRAIDACVIKLGDAHRPQPAAKIVTVGLRDCLGAAGWHGAGIGMH